MAHSNSKASPDNGVAALRNLARRRERELYDTRRAVLNLLEDLEADRQLLLRSEQEWRAAFDGIRDAMFVHDEQFRIVRANRAYALQAGKPVEALLGQIYFQVHPRGDGPLPGCPEIEPGDVELEVDGTVFRCRAFAVPDPEGRRRFALHILEDITERRRSETALQERSLQLHAANRELEQALADLKTAEQALVQTEKLTTIGILAGGVAHELNNPLMGLMGYVEYARSRTRDPASEQALIKALGEMQRMAGIVRNLLTLGQPRGDEVKPVRIHEVLERTLSLVRCELQQAGMTWEQDLGDALPPVWADESGLQQVFLNLVLNARDAVALEPERRLSISAREEEEGVCIAFHDTGPGVPRELHNRIFEPFFTTKAPGAGTGLGLSISRQILSGYGGSLVCDDTAEAGATFVVRLHSVTQPVDSNDSAADDGRRAGVP